MTNKDTAPFVTCRYCKHNRRESDSSIFLCDSVSVTDHEISCTGFDYDREWMVKDGE